MCLGRERFAAEEEWTLKFSLDKISCQFKTLSYKGSLFLCGLLRSVVVFFFNSADDSCWTAFFLIL